MDAQRKKPGRPPKITLLPKIETENIKKNTSTVGLVQSEMDEATALVAISPVPDEDGTISVECRRSSRKKIPKFDVRDLLLNKHRKPHKIQIEARFDSNAPSTSSSSALSGDESTPKNKCFIEKTSIIQRPAAPEENTQVPIPLKTEIFKPSQTSSLIVAQMESSPGQKQQQKLSKLSFEASESDTITPKRRGRPPKNRIATIENLKANVNIDAQKTQVLDTVENSPSSPQEESSSFQSAFESSLHCSKETLFTASAESNDNLSNDCFIVEIEEEPEQEVEIEEEPLDSVQECSESNKINLPEVASNLEETAKEVEMESEFIHPITENESAEVVIFDLIDNSAENSVEMRQEIQSPSLGIVVAHEPDESEKNNSRVIKHSIIDDDGVICQESVENEILCETAEASSQRNEEKCRQHADESSAKEILGESESFIEIENESSEKILRTVEFVDSQEEGEIVEPIISSTNTEEKSKSKDFPVNTAADVVNVTPKRRGRKPKVKLLEIEEKPKNIEFQSDLESAQESVETKIENAIKAESSKLVIHEEIPENKLVLEEKERKISTETQVNQKDSERSSSSQSAEQYIKETDDGKEFLEIQVSNLTEINETQLESKSPKAEKVQIEQHSTDLHKQQLREEHKKSESKLSKPKVHKKEKNKEKTIGITDKYLEMLELQNKEKREKRDHKERELKLKHKTKVDSKYKDKDREKYLPKLKEKSTVEEKNKEKERLLTKDKLIVSSSETSQTGYEKDKTVEILSSKTSEKEKNVNLSTEKLMKNISQKSFEQVLNKESESSNVKEKNVIFKHKEKKIKISSEEYAKLKHKQKEEKRHSEKKNRKSKLGEDSSKSVPTAMSTSTQKESEAKESETSFLKALEGSTFKKQKKTKEISDSQSKEDGKQKEGKELKSISASKIEEFKKKHVKSTEKDARKERQLKLKAAFEAALQGDVALRQRVEKSDAELWTNEIIEKMNQQPLPSEKIIENSADELKLPPTPGESDTSIVKEPIDGVPSKSASSTEPDPLYDIAKFIEDGVNLLKRDYKLAEDDEAEKQQKAAGSSTAVPTTDDKDSKPELSTAAVNLTSNELNDDVTNIESTTLDQKPESPINGVSFYETPADTPVSTPRGTTPTSSPIPTDATDNTDNSLDTYYYSDGKRRSHRLKKITNTPKALEGRGLAKLHYNIEDHLLDLAEVEAKNAKFLKEMEERLSNFEVIKENVYHCERIVSREARKMICDCFLTPEEAERGELGCGEDCLNRLLMIECGVSCRVGDRCTNNRFQKHLCAPCRVFRTEKKGFGIMADVEIHPGEFIMEYVGEVLDSDKFEDRRIAYSKYKNRHYYFMALRSDAIIDATTKGNISRFINHSCDPNAETQKWTVNGELRIGFFSRRTVLPGEEITFDYQYQRYGREAQRCYCESENCRGWIGEEPNSDEGEQIDDDDDDDEASESGSSSEVEGLMSVDDADIDFESEEGKIRQNAAAKAGLQKSKSKQDADVSKSLSLDVDSDESKQKFMAYLGKISAKIEMHKQNKREEKKRRKRRQRKQTVGEKRLSTSSTGRFLEDPDLEDEIDFLSRCGLKNQSDTLRLSRLMVRAKLIATRLNLLAILRDGELPCRRLFLDYHGLHLLHGWINEDGRTDMNIRVALLQTLECLPIPNKTILTESKVYQAIRSWGNSEKQPKVLATIKTEGTSSSPSDESSKESDEQKTQQQNASENETSAPSKSDDAEKMALKLINAWDNLPEIFRIPKRERIEQMKEHEREADRQYAATIEATEEDDEEKTAISTDRYQRDRFERRFGTQYDARTIGIVGASNTTAGGLYKRTTGLDALSPEDNKNLSKEQRRELFAAKVARDEAEKRLAERRREFDTKCNFFGLDARITRPEDVPFCVSDAGQWFNERRQQIATPPAFAHVQTPIKPKSTNPSDYYLPKAVTTLPPEWTYAITNQGKIYYYHLKHRVPQWEPPTEEQISQTKWSDAEDDLDLEEDVEDLEELSEERIKEIESIQTQEDLQTFLKKISKEQRQTRYKKLVEERSISPRREEDRIYNQIEMRKYKENKEKIKKRKEEIRRRRSEAKNSTLLSIGAIGTLGSLLDAAVKISSTSTVAAAENAKTEETDLPSDALPIQDYLLSSDDDNDIDEMKAECNNSPLLEKIVQGDKIVDELDALTTKRPLKRQLPPHRDISADFSSSSSNNGGGGNSSFSNELPSVSLEKSEYKKRRQEKKEKSKRSRDSNDAKYRKLKEKFRCEIAGIIVQHLKPYRKDTCTFGRIKSNEDFNHLAKKLTHFVMIKELKYCESVGQTLVVTESVKNKSREFIKKYMAKYEAGYVRSQNDPEFKDIPFTL